MKLIIFDIDGTLSHTKQVDDKCFIKAFNTVFGIDLKYQNWSELANVTDWGITEEIIFKNFNRFPSQEEYSLFCLEFIKLLKYELNKDASQFKEVKGAKSFFDFINNNTHHDIGIATGAWQESALLKLHALGINTNNIAFSNSSKHKSREDIIIDVIEQASFKKSNNIIYFGDGSWDYTTCKNLGIKFIGIDVENDNNLKKLGADVVFNDFQNRDLILAEIEKQA